VVVVVVVVVVIVVILAVVVVVVVVIEVVVVLVVVLAVVVVVVIVVIVVVVVLVVVLEVVMVVVVMVVVVVLVVAITTDRGSANYSSRFCNKTHLPVVNTHKVKNLYKNKNEKYSPPVCDAVYFVTRSNVSVKLVTANFYSEDGRSRFMQYLCTHQKIKSHNSTLAYMSLSLINKHKYNHLL
jgi:energy-coupling factor transporter transmembrane protein EcfT